MELDLLLEREPWRAGLEALQSWHALELLDPDLQRDRRWPWRLRHAERMGLPLLPALLLAAGDPLAVAERLQLPHRHQQHPTPQINKKTEMTNASSAGGALAGHAPPSL